MATYHGLVRYTHLRCGLTITSDTSLEVLNDLDPACPKCSLLAPPNFPPPEAYGVVVWETEDGLLSETETSDDGSDLLRRERVITHLSVRKSWVNGPEWWVRAEPSTGDIDDELIVGFDTFEHALAALPDVPTILVEAYGKPLAFRDRTDFAYRIIPNGD